MILYLLTTLTLSFQAAADYEQILDIAEKYHNQKKSVTSLEAEKREVLGLLYKIEKETSLIARDKSRLQGEEIGLQKDLKRTSQEIVALESRLAAIGKTLQGRWDLMQKMQELPWLYIFLSSANPQELEQTEYLFRNLNQKEISLATDYLGKLKSLVNKRAELNRLALELIGVRKDLKAKETKLKNQHLMKKDMVASLESKIKVHKRSLRLTKNLGKRMSSQESMADFAILFATSFFDKKGDLPHPVKNPIIHNYGFNEAFKSPLVQLLHKGYFYKAKPGTEVKAIAPGRVAFYEPIRGLGKVLIIDHGSNYYSIYGNLQRKLKKVAAIVQAGDAVGLSGQGSFQFNEGLYFEIRHFAEPENPNDWLKKRNSIEDLATRSSTKIGDT